MARNPRLMPTRPRLFTGEVVGTRRLSPSFQRVTVAGPDLAGFAWQGLDHWFRLFIPSADGAGLTLPNVEGRSWWRSYLAIPEDVRPHCSNYTVADHRVVDGGGELDIDVVLHWHEGELGGAVAAWAETAQPGSPVALLDQGVLFDPPTDTDAYVLAADESGLPAVRGILRDLAEDSAGRVVLEVPDAGDVSDFPAPHGMDVEWLVRNDERTPGQAALDALRSAPAPGVGAYAFVVGESGLATGGRRVLRRAGLPASRITFSGFWKA